jgi:hypothetical protein
VKLNEIIVKQTNNSLIGKWVMQSNGEVTDKHSETSISHLDDKTSRNKNWMAYCAINLEDEYLCR